MKLYTESEVRKAIELSRDTHQEGRAYMERDEYDYSMDEVFELLTPIEFASYDDIKDESMKHYDNNGADYYFEIGAKWMHFKIQGGNK